MLTHERQHKPLVVVAHSALICAAMKTAFGRFRRTVLCSAGFHRAPPPIPRVLLPECVMDATESIINKSDLIIDSCKAVVFVLVESAAG